MKNLVFTKTGDIQSFIDWLERFGGDISKDSIVIEVDTVNSVFVAKTFTSDRSLVRYSKISFADANFELTQKDDDLNSRVLVGIFLILTKFIKAIKTFATTNEFKMTITYDMLMIQNTEKWCSQAVVFESKTLKMQIPGSSISAIEMNPMTDETFDTKVWVAPEPVSVTLDADIIKNLVSVSDIFASSDKNSNVMEFYTKEETEDDETKTPVMFVRDPEEHSYDYRLGNIEGELTRPVSLQIYREKFLLAIKNAYDTTTITVSVATPNRILMALTDGNTKTVIARLNN